jgi:hypothetical protein
VNNLIAPGWRAYIVIDPSNGQLRIAMGHRDMNTYSNVFYEVESLNAGIEIDIGKMMDVAMGVRDET